MMNALNPIIIDETVELSEPMAAPVTVPMVGPVWETLVTPGHVIGRRLERFGKARFLPAVLAAIGALTAGYFAFNASNVSLADNPALTGFLLGNPDTYTDLGGGVRTSYRAAWLTGYAPARGLTGEGWTNLNKAVMADLNRFGLEPQAWTATVELDPAPLVTRPAKVFSEHSARLETGIVVLPEGERSIQIVAWVEGSLSLVSYSPDGCVLAFGPAVEGCNPAVSYQSYAMALDAMKPAPNTQE